MKINNLNEPQKMWSYLDFCVNSDQGVLKGQRQAEIVKITAKAYGF